MLLAALASLAIVTQDQTALRAAPRDSAPQQAMLWAGDSLEIRGQQADYLQVYDHRRERAGYVRLTQVRETSLRPEEAPELLAVIRFVRDTPGAEAVGIAYSAAYFKAAPAGTIQVEALDALGSIAERLARRASAKQAKGSEAEVTAHLDVAAEYGVRFNSIAHDGGEQLCYDGEAFQHVLALPASAEQQARAALALSRPDCLDPNLRPDERYALTSWQAQLLDKVPTTTLPAYLKNRLLLRRAGVWASLAYQKSRRGETAQIAAATALSALAGLDKHELTDQDQSAYNEAAIRVGASRWAAMPAEASSAMLTPGKLALRSHAGAPGQTCIDLVDGKAQTPLFSQCTYGQVWPASARANSQGTALTVAVQALDSWRELWLVHQTAHGWRLDVLPPATDNPDMGYIEFAGWVPGGQQMLAAREVKVGSHYLRSFEVIDLDTLATAKQADRPQSLRSFYKWQDAGWKQMTVSLR